MIELFNVAVTINGKQVVFRNVDWPSYILLQSVANEWNGKFEELEHII
ncbi:hypothetical protein STPL106120_08180 [Streptococcus pluranimalium]